MNRYTKIWVVVGILFGAWHVISATHLYDVVIDKPNQVRRVNDDCRQLIVTKEAKNCHIQIDAAVMGDVQIDGDNCTLDLLPKASFGPARSWWQWFFSWGCKSTNAFCINGDNCIVRVGTDAKKITAQCVITGNKAQVHAVIDGSAWIQGNHVALHIVGGSVTIDGDQATVSGAIGGSLRVEGNGARAHKIGGSARIGGNNCIVQGAIGGSAIIEGNDVRVQKVGGSAEISGNDCVVHGAIGGSVVIDGDRCSIHASIGGSAKVSGLKCTIYGSVGGSAVIKSDTVIAGSVGGKKIVTP